MRISRYSKWRFFLRVICSNVVSCFQFWLFRIWLVIHQTKAFETRCSMLYQIDDLVIRVQDHCNGIRGTDAYRYSQSLHRGLLWSIKAICCCNSINYNRIALLHSESKQNTRLFIINIFTLQRCFKWFFQAAGAKSAHRFSFSITITHKTSKMPLSLRNNLPTHLNKIDNKNLYFIDNI